MQGYIITDVKNKERYKNAAKNIEKAKSSAYLQLEISEAIMANRMDESEIYRQVYMPTFLKLGEIGCALSHLSVYKKMIECNIPYALILEDDACLTEKFLDEGNVREIISFIESCDEPSIMVLQRSIYHHKKQRQYTNFSVWSARNLFGMYGYIINQKAAENILRIQSPLRFEIDAFKFYYWLDACKLYCLDKEFVEVEEDVANISLINDISCRDYCNQRAKIKKKNFRVLYDELSISNKFRVTCRRFIKFINKKNETLDY